MEGVMMRDEKSYAMAIRNAQTKEIMCVKEQIGSASKKNKIFALPVIRGVMNFGQMLSLGMKSLTKSASLCGIEEEGEPSKFETYITNKLGDKAEKVLMSISIVFSDRASYCAVYDVTITTGWRFFIINNKLISA